jgi:hypothetical protein
MAQLFGSAHEVAHVPAGAAREKCDVHLTPANCTTKN